MPDRSFNAIIGAGVAGLTLAHGLHRSGVHVAVYEREANVDSRGQDYRIHPSADSAIGLFRCLPPRLYYAVVTTTGKPSHQITTVSHGLRRLTADRRRWRRVARATAASTVGERTRRRPTNDLRQGDSQ
ncbi:MAG TPA: NAD(P)-binding protein [Nitrolancea sp.]